MTDDTDGKEEVRVMLARLPVSRKCDWRCPYWFDCPVVGTGEDGKCALVATGDDGKTRFLNLARSDEQGVLGELAKTLWRYGRKVEEDPTAGNLATYMDLLLRYFRVRYPTGGKAKAAEESNSIDVKVMEVPVPRKKVVVAGMEVEVPPDVDLDDPESLFNSRDEVLTGNSNGQHDQDAG